LLPSFFQIEVKFQTQQKVDFKAFSMLQAEIHEAVLGLKTIHVFKHSPGQRMKQ